MNKIFPKLVFLLAIFSTQILANNSSIVQSLGWITDKKSNNLCKGYYQQPKIVSSTPNPPDYKREETTATAKNKVFYSITGDSILEGEVTVNQPGRQAKADRVVLHRSSATGKISSADLIGHVELRENGRLLIGEKAHIDFEKNTAEINNVIYRVNAMSPTGIVDFWGRAQNATRDANEVITMHHATTTTCAPSACTWHVTSSTAKYNKNTQIAEIYNGAFFFKGIPFFYTPYLYFSTSQERKTGLLVPSINYSANLGTELDLPIYLNLAPNYDATITPRIMSKQGVLFDGVFRYLTTKNTGKVTVDYIYDQGINSLISADLKNYDTDNPNDPNFKLVKTLKDENKNRGYFSWQNDTKFDQHWSGQEIVNYSSDDYFLHDFNFSPNIVNNDQLMNKADLKYNGEHWNFFSQLQGYQTLHMLGLNTQDQYLRLPQLDLNGDYPNQAFGLEYLLKSEFVNFSHSEPNFNSDQRVPTGDRTNLQPGISYPLNFSSGYITPTIQAPITFYNLQNVQQDNPSNIKTITRIIPITNVDAGLVLERNFSMLGTGYIQTLEPRIFYLYVPKIKQNDIPDFDSHLSSFDFNTLFRVNRFSSIDRIGDANQMSVGLTSRFLDANSGQEKLRLAIGQTYAYSKHTVLLDPNDKNLDPLVNNYISPFIGEATVNLSQAWSATGSLTVNIANGLPPLNNIATGLQFKPDLDHILNLNYTFTANGDSIQGKTVDLNRFDISTAWLIEKHWRILIDYNYNFSATDYQEALLGLEYDTCCWALRIIGERIFNGYNNDSHSGFDNRAGIQFMLKGLGSLTGGDAVGALPHRIAGFQDNFVTGVF